jgi:single-strand selective monofunctional uracil DNA glycosylase
VEILEPTWVVGVGAFAEQRAREVLADRAVRIGRVLHPSPASPKANRDWAGAAARDLRALGLCG